MIPNTFLTINLNSVELDPVNQSFILSPSHPISSLYKYELGIINGVEETNSWDIGNILYICLKASFSLWRINNESIAKHVAWIYVAAFSAVPFGKLTILPTSINCLSKYGSNVFKPYFESNLSYALKTELMYLSSSSKKEETM